MDLVKMQLLILAGLWWGQDSTVPKSYQVMPMLFVVLEGVK